MISLKISDVKECMTHLLLMETFDSFEFISGSITTFCTFQMDGYLQKKFFESQEETVAPLSTYVHWEKMRPYCFQIIKGKTTPVEFQLVFGLPSTTIQDLLRKEGIGLSPEQVGGLYLNFRFSGNDLYCTTGVSLNAFTLDKSLEHTWDKMAELFFRQSNIAYETATH